MILSGKAVSYILGGITNVTAIRGMAKGLPIVSIVLDLINIYLVAAEETNDFRVNTSGLAWDAIAPAIINTIAGENFYDTRALGKDVSPEVYNKAVKSEENFDAWPEEDQIGWCLRNSTPKNYKGPLTCKAVLNKADPKEVARIRKILGTDRGAGKTDDKFAMSVPAID